MIAQAARLASRTVYFRFGERGLLVSIIDREQENRLRLEQVVDGEANLDKCLIGIAEGMLPECAATYTSIPPSQLLYKHTA